MIELSAWTANDEASLRRFLEMGISSITTRMPVLLLKLRRKTQSVYEVAHAAGFTRRNLNAHTKAERSAVAGKLGRIRNRTAATAPCMKQSIVKSSAARFPKAS